MEQRGHCCLGATLSPLTDLSAIAHRATADHRSLPLRRHHGQVRNLDPGALLPGLNALLGELDALGAGAQVPGERLLLDQVPHALGIPISVETVSLLVFIVTGALICFLLIVEPHGFARLWSTGKEKLRLWPYPY